MNYFDPKSAVERYATGHPVVVLPLTRSARGLPIGLQVVGRRWGEIRQCANLAWSDLDEPYNFNNL